MAMHGYFFAAKTTRSQMRPEYAGRGQTVLRPQVWDACSTVIVCDDEVPSAQKRFEGWLCDAPAGENPIQTRIDKIIVVQVQDQLLAETGNVPIDWSKVSEEAEKALGSTPEDDFEQGYWLDVNVVTRPSLSIDVLRRELPEEIASGLNWSADKQFYYLITVFKAPPEPVYDPNIDLPVEREVPEVPAVDERDFETGLVPKEIEFPQMEEKESVVVARARNAAVAVWLWRKYSAKGKLERNPIRIDPWCGTVGEE